LAGCRCQW
jgi:Nitroreductase family.